MKRIVLLGLIIGLGMNLMAQSMEQGGIDTVTVGSSVTYAVDPDPVTAADVNMNASHFDWFFTSDAGGSTVITAGITVAETQLSDGYAEDSINVAYDSATYLPGTTIYTRVAEVSQPMYGTSCRGNEQVQEVFIVNEPFVTLVTGSTGGCGITQDTVPLTVNGYGPFNVDFTVTYYDAANNPTVHNYSESIGAVSDQGANSLDLILNTTSHLTDGTGRYEVVIDDITDRFSRKSMVALTGNVTSGTFTIGINPVPTTQPIRHIRNLGN
jgi:hypothetical protein